jgi:Bacterial Ig domain/PKD domain
MGPTRRFRRIALLLCALVLVHRDARAQASAWLAWDEDPSARVDGYAVRIDGVRVDYGLSALNSNLTCGCAIVLPFSGGSHTLQAGAYNSSGESWSSVVTVAPVANAGGPYSGAVNTALGVNGSGSQDPTGTITTYAWNWGDGTGATSSSATAMHTYASSGTFTVTLTVTDNAGASAAASTTSTIAASTDLGTDTPPVANDDLATVRRFNRSVTIPVLQNDLDADGDPLTILGVGTPSHGSVSISGGTLVYTSSKRYVGPVTFAYTIGDGRGGTATATVYMTVTQ